MKIFFKTLLLIIVATIGNNNVLAQRIEINPNIGWKYILSQKIELQNGSQYQFEFPATEANDYIFSLFFDKSNVKTFIQVFDMQMKPIADMKDLAVQESAKLEFRVPSSGTYIILAGYAIGEVYKPIPANINMALITRPIVD